MKDYNFYYWRPLLFKIKMNPVDLKKCADLCSKKSSEVDETLAGVIKHQHYISATHYSRIINPYFDPFRQAYLNWYGKTITQANIHSCLG